MVFINATLDGSLAARVSAELMTLDAMGTQPIDIYIDSTDGTLDAALALMDTIELLKAEARTQAMGELGGAAVGVLAVGKQRTATPSARLRLVEPATRADGRIDQMTAFLEHQQLLLGRFREILARATDRPQSDIADDLRRGRYLDAREALDYRLIDAIAAPGIPTGTRRRE
jgi:ATP-dependent Clp protease protease subunit